MNDDSDTLADASRKPPLSLTKTSSARTKTSSVSSAETDRGTPTKAQQPGLTPERSRTLSSDPYLPQGEDSPSHVVGIGASAGGLPALQAIFDGIPHDTGAAFVVVQHLSPNFNTCLLYTSPSPRDS